VALGHKDDVNLVQRCMTIEVDRTIRDTRSQMHDGVKEDIKSFRLSRDDAQVENNWEGKLRRQSPNTGTESNSNKRSK